MNWSDLNFPPAGRTLTCAACLVSVLAVPVTSRAAEPNEIQIGPVEYQQNVNGVLVSVSALTYVRVETVENKVRLNARLVGDFIDLQRKIGPIVDTFDLPHDNCRSYSANNPVVSIPRKELSYHDGTAWFSIGGSVTDWQCLENPVPNSKVEWEIRDIGFGIKTKVPVVKTWPGNPIKTILVTQPFDANLPVALTKRDDHSVALEFSKPDIELKGQYAFITDGILKLAGIDVNQKAYDALQKAIDPTKLRLAIPEELSQYSPTVTTARLFDNAGHLSAEIQLAAEIPAAAITQLLKELLNHSKT
jgi:hypothetical protein